MGLWGFEFKGTVIIAEKAQRPEHGVVCQVFTLGKQREIHTFIPPISFPLFTLQSWFIEW